MEKIIREENNERLCEDRQKIREFQKEINKTFAQSIQEDYEEFLVQNYDLKINDLIILKRFCEFLKRDNKNNTNMKGR